MLKYLLEMKQVATKKLFTLRMMTKMKSDNYISEHVQRDLYDAFELYYSLIFGFLDLD